MVTASLVMLSMAEPGCKGSSSASPQGSVLGGPLTGERFGIAGVPGATVRIGVPIGATSSDLGYANIAIDANGDGVITPDEWVTQNVPIVVAPTTYGFFGQVADTTVTSAAVTAAVSAAPVAAPWDGSTPAGGVAMTSTVGLTEHDLPVADPPPLPGIGGGGGPAPPAPSAPGLEPLGDPPPTPVDQVIHPGVPNTAQGDDKGDDNTCVAHAISSSLAWLARKYGFTGGFMNPWVTDAGPGSVNDGVDTLTTDVLATFSNAGLYTRQTGVQPGDIIPGKQAYVDANGLPVQTTRIPCDPTDSSGNGVFDGIKQALNAQCAVEVVVTLSGVRQSAHIVSVVGYKDTGTQQTIYVHDSQNAPLGENDPVEDTPMVLVNKTTVNAWPTPNTQQGGTAVATIQFAIQECPSGSAATAANAGAWTCPLSVNPISASFNQATYTTTYTVGIQNSMAQAITTTWTGPNCGTFMPTTASTSSAQTINATMSWFHAGTDVPGGTCMHPTPDHTDATIVATVTNGTTTFSCSYVGAATGKGMACTTQ